MAVLAARRSGLEGLLVASVMLLAALLLLLAWPLRQLTLVPVAALVLLAPSVHALVLRRGGFSWTPFAGGVVAGIAVIVALLAPIVESATGDCQVSVQPTALAADLAGAVTFGAAYVVAAGVTLRIAAGSDRASRLGLAVIAGMAVMTAVTVTASTLLSNLGLSQFSVACGY